MAGMMNAIGKKKLVQVPTIGEALVEAMKGHFGCVECPHGAITMWRNDDGMYCATTMQTVGYESTNAADALEWASLRYAVLRDTQG
jgi:hypothetical protein